MSGVWMLGYCVYAAANGVIWAKPAPAAKVVAPSKVAPAQHSGSHGIVHPPRDVASSKPEVAQMPQVATRYVATRRYTSSQPVIPTGDLVAPLSNGLSLHWGLNQVRQKFGQPKLGGSCELNYGNFVVSQCGGSPSVLINAADVRLRSGVGIGTDRAEVERVFGANPYDPTVGLYRLVFSYMGNNVSAISIVYMGTVARAPTVQNVQTPPNTIATSRTTLTSEHPPVQNPEYVINPVGVYWCYEPSWSSGSIRLLPEGDYQINDVTVGHYTLQKSRIIFTGYLKDRNNGIAQLDNGNIVFKWTDNKGELQYFAYRKGR
jgi:hypothetical protein